MSLLNLPVELQLQVFYALDLTSILNLSATSSHFKAVYDNNRAVIIKHSVPTVLGKLIKRTCTDPAIFLPQAARLEREV